MPSSISSSKSGIHRDIPDLPWSGIVIAVAIAVALAATGWELRCRAAGYAPGLDDTTDLWVEARRTVQPDSTVIIGSSRGLFDLDLDVLEQGLGKRPVQLSLVGSCVYPVLRHLADDASFHGTVLCDVVPGLLMVPPFAPPYHNSEKAVARLHAQTWSQWAGHRLSIPLEWTFAALQQEDLTLSALLHQIPIPDRARAQIGPRLPPFFYTIDRDRRSRMISRVENDQALRDRIRFGWAPLFTPPPKPIWIPDEAFGPFMGKLMNDRFVDMAKAVGDLRNRGARVIFLRLPSSGDLHALEDKLTPRPAVWDRLLADTTSQGICFEDNPELATFECPEWSHLSATDSLEFTQRLTPILSARLGAVPLK